MTDEIIATYLGSHREMRRLDAWINFFPPPGKLRIGCFLPLTLLSRGKGLWHIPAQAAISFLLWVARLCQSHQSFKMGKTEASPLGSPLKKVGVLDTQINAFCFVNSPDIKLRGKLLISLLFLSALQRYFFSLGTVCDPPSS